MNKMHSYIAGFAAILIAIVCWQLEAEAIQSIQVPSSPNYFNKPYFLTWFLSGGYMIFLPLWLIVKLYKLKKKNIPTRDIFSPRLLFQQEEIWVMKMGAISSVPYFLCGYFWYLSIVHTSVTGNTVIYDSAFIFIFIFSIFLLRERISLLKILSVIVSFLGLVFVVWSGSQSEEEGVDQTVMGYILVATSTILCSFYDVIYKKYGTKPNKIDKGEMKNSEPNLQHTEINGNENENEFKNENEDEDYNIPEKIKVVDAEDIPIESSFLFQGTIGLVTVLCFWPAFIPLDLSGFEIFEWPDWEITKILFVNMIFDDGTAMGFLLAINWTTPLLVGVGSLLNIPISVFLDMIIHSYLLPWYGFIGVGCIVLGFVLLSAADVLLSSQKKNSENNFFTSLRHFFVRSCTLTDIIAKIK
mmetsp:Transcript_32632/g.50664  ORF Transcript_32632/g.50664 Transcript_32632/m.50664 type:complete len:413 (-) Transcript_32632:89-1327(-)